jgi:hypothetical protein
VLGLGRQARERRNAVKIIIQAMEWASYRELLNLAPEPGATDRATLAEQLMARVSKWPTRKFAGQVLPNPSAVGLAMEALAYGLDDMSSRPADQQQVIGGLGRVLRYAAEHPDKINDADYELFQVFGRRFLNHPAVAAARTEDKAA